MIGVATTSADLPVVEEFFQLFKTPWEVFRAGTTYDAVLDTTGTVPAGSARVMIVFSSAETSLDREWQIHRRANLSGSLVRFQSREMPIYGDLGVFEGQTDETIAVVDGAGAVAVRQTGSDRFRIGYDLFKEARRLLINGQPAAHGRVPTLELHIQLIRECLTQARASWMEIPPHPAGYKFAVALTHDIDFAGIRDHFFDHTMCGFLYRATWGSLRNWLRGRIPAQKLLRNWSAVARLPLIYFGWARDFWSGFEWYLRVEAGIPATYFFIPFAGSCGAQVPGTHRQRRAARYDVAELAEPIRRLLSCGNEVAVHGIDAWHCVKSARREREKISHTAGREALGIRMHWLLREDATFEILNEAGYAYDSTGGYNEQVGFLFGTGQVFRPEGSQRLLELPLTIQDGAMFFGNRLGLDENEAWGVCQRLISDAERFGGVVVFNWHDRSYAPERLWGEFYERLVGEMRSRQTWFATAGEIVNWFQKRRDVRFERARNGTIRIKLSGKADAATPPLIVRRYLVKAEPAGAPEVCLSVVDEVWTGADELILSVDHLRETAASQPGEKSVLVNSLTS